jgi:hypothetical protein
VYVAQFNLQLYQLDFRNLTCKVPDDILQYKLWDFVYEACVSFGFQMLDRLSDIMTFGCLERCKECKGGQFVYCSGVGYQCLGDLTEWTKCQNKTLEPKRKPFKVPPELLSDHEFL